MRNTVPCQRRLMVLRPHARADDFWPTRHLNLSHRQIWSFTQIHMKSWPIMKLCQVGIVSNIAHKHSWIFLRITFLVHRKSYLVIIYTNSYNKINQRWIYVKLESDWTLLRITHLAHRKSYLLIICPNSHEKLIKSEIRSSSSRFEHCSESLI